jgi:phosphatidylserine/phosphatidylglycerophosphate/cardiolipin synthase-like enzyme
MLPSSVPVSPSTCWRIERAGRAAVIIDAADYFDILRSAMMKAEKRIMLVGWDFDTRILIGRHKRKRHEPPGRIGDFILWLANTRPDLEIKILKWGMGAVKMLSRGSTMITAARWAMHDRIQFKFDTAHPAGCSHHQKIVVIDDNFAVCGGIDTTASRRDTRAHTGHDKRRKNPNGKYYTPWHDITMVADGAVAKALGELARDRWHVANGDTLDPVESDNDPWPEALAPQLRDVTLAISRTRAEWQDVEAVNEIEKLHLAQIEAAERFIYMENQYFTSRKIAEAIAKRLDQPDPPEIVLVTPKTADGWLEQKAMDGARAQLIRSLAKKPGAARFAVYCPVNEADEDIYVHAKLTIEDDESLRIGSANLNNRSMGLDSECDMTLDCHLPGNEDCTAMIRDLRHSLIAEHCGVEPEIVADALAGDGSMIGFIDARPNTGKRLVRLELPELTDAEKFVAENELLDPDSPEGFFEPLHKRGLFRKRRLKRPD